MNPFEGFFRYLAVFTRHLGRRMYLVLFLSMLAAFSEGVGITLILPLLASLDVGLGAKESIPSGLAWVTDALGASGSLVGIMLLISSAFLMKGLINFASVAYAGVLQAHLLRELRRRVYDACTTMTYSYYANKNTGHFINVVNTQTQSFYLCFSSYISFLTHLIKAVVYLIIAFVMAWRFGLMALVAGVLLLSSFRVLNRYVRKLSLRIADELSVLNGLLVQALQAYKYLASTDLMARTGKDIHASIERMTRHRVRTQVWQAFTSSVSEPISVVLISAIILIQVVALDQPLAPILVAIILFNRGTGALMTVQNQWQTAMSNVGAVEMVENELDALANNQEVSGSKQLERLRSGLELKDVLYAYEPDAGAVVRNISLVIPARKTVALVGLSGAGKSTLVDMITLMLRPQSGEIYIDGVPSSEIDLRSWRSQIGYVSQDTVVFDDSIAANISMESEGAHCSDETLTRIKAAAEQAQLSAFIDGLPKGYETDVGDRGVRLSGGQRQRLFIARELYRKPSLLILDEATSALDSESELGVQKSIEQLHGKMAVVIIAHRLSTIKNVDTIFVLENGQIVESGSYRDLTECGQGQFSSMVGLQSL